MPLENDTTVADVCHWSAIAANRLAAPPEPIGKKHRPTAIAPVRDQSSDFRSRPSSRMLARKCGLGSGLGGVVMFSSTTEQPSRPTAVAAAGSHWTEVCSARSSASPPTSAPPRLPALSQPATRPRSSGAVTCAISASVDMPTKVVARPLMKMIAVSRSTVSGPIGTNPIARIAAELTTLVATYQPLPFHSVSIAGAHANFQVWGRVLIATIAATVRSERPASCARYAIVTWTNPAVAPKGRNRIANRIGDGERRGLDVKAARYHRRREGSIRAGGRSRASACPRSRGRGPGCPARGGIVEVVVGVGLGGRRRGGAVAARRTEDLVGRALGDDQAVLEPDRAVGERPGLAERVGDVDQRDVEVVDQVADQRGELDLELAVERRERLVEQHHLGRHRQGPGQGDPLGLAARERRRPAPGQVGGADPVEQGVGSLGALAAGQGPVHAVGDVVGRVEVGEQGQALEDVGDPALVDRDHGLGGGVEPDLAAERDPAGAGPDQPGDDAEQRALARARAPDHARDAGREPEVDVEREPGVAAPDLGEHPEGPLSARHGASAGSGR